MVQVPGSCSRSCVMQESDRFGTLSDRTADSAKKIKQALDVDKENATARPGTSSTCSAPRVLEGRVMIVKRKASRRELVDTGTEKRYVRLGRQGRFKEGEDVTRLLRQDVKRKAKTKTAPGRGDK